MSATRILVVGGVTASGKTGAAIAIAERFGGELVGADSVQVYRGFDIGSAKPGPEELDRARHHLIDVVDPDVEIDAAGYADLADEAIRDITSRGRLPIVVGGTGLWLRALLRGLVDLPPVDPEIRARLGAEADARGAPAMHARLGQVDPIAQRRIHPNDRLRILRALEVFEQTGTPLGALHDEHALGAPRYDALTFVLDRPREELHLRLKARIRAMLDRGWVDEVRSLLAKWGPDARAMGSVGYREVKAHVLEGVALEETERLAYKSTRIYARRQRTWFRSEPGEKTWTTADALLAPSEDRTTGELQQIGLEQIGLETIEAWLALRPR